MIGVSICGWIKPRHLCLRAPAVMETSDQQELMLLNTSLK
jgi:hypothetical protein